MRWGAATCNLVQLVDGITPAKASRLSDAALVQIGAAFTVAAPAAYTLENTNHELMDIARGDIQTAVNCLMDRHGRFPEAKWSSLQAAEKVMKAAICLRGTNFEKTHELDRLRDQLFGIGLRFDATDQFDALRCRLGIRYGQESCTRDEALAAHHASLEIVNILSEAGAEFTLGIGGMQFSD